MIRLLLIDDDSLFFDQVELIFADASVHLTWASTASDGLRLLQKDPQNFDVILQDFDLPDAKGDFVAKQINALMPELPVVFATAHQDRDVLLRLLSTGVAKGFFLKGGHPEVIRPIVIEAAQKYRKSRQVLKGPAFFQRESLSPMDGLVGKSPQLQEVKKKIAKYKKHHSPVLIVGESGTGKELVAKALVLPQQEFIAINCAKYANNDSLLESELFGYVKGAFTGAQQNHVGLLEKAKGALVFFDEVHTLSLSSQQKLLRTLQEKKIRRVGDNSEKEISTDFRVVAATKPDIQNRMANGHFLLDLYYRINTFAIHVPRLTDRIEDLEDLVLYFCKDILNRTGVEKGFRAETLRSMERYSWPGQVRELKNAVERMIVDGESEIIEPHDFENYLLESQGATHDPFLVGNALHAEYMKKVEHHYFKTLLLQCSQREELVEKCGISRATLYRKLSELGLINSCHS